MLSALVMLSCESSRISLSNEAISLEKASSLLACSCARAVANKPSMTDSRLRFPDLSRAPRQDVPTPLDVVPSRGATTVPRRATILAPSVPSAPSIGMQSRGSEAVVLKASSVQSSHRRAGSKPQRDHAAQLDCAGPSAIGAGASTKSDDTSNFPRGIGKSRSMYRVASMVWLSERDAPALSTQPAICGNVLLSSPTPTTALLPVPEMPEKTHEA